MARVLLGVTGGIAAYKACELARLLAKAGHEVIPIVTSGAERFVALETFEALARHEMPRELYPHLAEADLLVIAPLSANTLAKLASGLADNVLTETALALEGARLAAPAMNTRMWEHPATQRNVATIRADGWDVIGPEVGELAEGAFGAGRMSEPDAIAARCAELLRPEGTCQGDRPQDLSETAALAGEQASIDALRRDPRPKGTCQGDRPRDLSLKGRRVVVSAGGTREPLDSVRFIGNRSSGRMGVAVAAEARRRGAEVTLLAANLAIAPPAGVVVVPTPTAADLAREALARADADVVVMAAAVADYRPANPLSGKREKNPEKWSVVLEPTEDVLAGLGRRRRNGQVIVGFAADEGARGLERARKKLANKGGQLFVYNDVSRTDIGFDTSENEVTLLGPHGERVIGKRSKEEVAVAILDEISTLLGQA
jgi:phosphopantothenoylcysteine decarboxylase / phosphopantothenate---cysteine ligase